jgi:ankyrin repeat protein
MTAHHCTCPGCAQVYSIHGGGTPLHAAARSSAPGALEVLRFLLPRLPSGSQLQQLLNWRGFNALHAAAVAGRVEAIRALVQAGFSVNQRSVLFNCAEQLEQKVKGLMSAPCCLLPCCPAACCPAACCPAACCPAACCPAACCPAACCPAAACWGAWRACKVCWQSWAGRGPPGAGRGASCNKVPHAACSHSAACLSRGCFMRPGSCCAVANQSMCAPPPSSAQIQEGITDCQPASGRRVAGGRQKLAAAGQLVDSMLQGGLTPLGLAAKCGRLEAVRVLLQLGAKVVPGVYQCSMVAMAMVNGHAAVAQLLQDFSKVGALLAGLIGMLDVQHGAGVGGGWPRSWCWCGPVRMLGAGPVQALRLPLKWLLCLPRSVAPGPSLQRRRRRPGQLLGRSTRP